MRRTCPYLSALVFAAALLLLPVHARAQGEAQISGVVTDTTGAVLPGVTVEAGSPALIEKVRVVVTDGQGRYVIVNLRPGTYAVTFSLTGFSVVRREGIELSAGFSAPVNAQLRVGSLEETVTVTGASPTVDVQSVRTQAVLSDDTLNQLPTGAQNVSALASLTLGATLTGNAGSGGVDVGGSGGEMGQISIHNNRATDMKISQDGMNTNNSMSVNGGILHFGQHYNMEGVAEVQMSSNGMSAETETAGLQINYIPKEGGNQLSFSARGSFGNESMQSDNLTPELEARGATSPPAIRRIYDVGGSMGGPVKRDSLWFFTAHRKWTSEAYLPGSFWNAVHGQKAPNGRPLYEPDRNRRTFTADPSREHAGRLTWQATDNDKIGYFGNYQKNCVCTRLASATRAPEAAQITTTNPYNHLSQVKWTRTQSSRLLFDAGWTYLKNPFTHRRAEGVTENDFAMFELSPTLFYNSFANTGIPYNEDDPSATDQTNARYAVSYVTGSHSFKVGGNWMHGWIEQKGSSNVIPGFGPAQVTTFNGVPISVTLFAQPQFSRSDYRNMAFYAQDQWTLNRFTLNLGVRLDLFKGWSPEQESPANNFVDAFHVNRVEDTPRWRDVSPRLGLAWDVTGDGRTAFKAAAGRYVAGMGTGLPLAINPANAISKTTARTWVDANNNFFPEGNPRNPDANGELGPSQNAAFGTPVITSFFDDDMLLDNRQYTWQMSTSIERELMENVRVAVSYFRTTHHNQTLVDNEAVGPSNYDAYSVTVPSSSLLPNGGRQLSGFADISFAGRATRPRNTTKLDTNFGDQTEVYNGANVEVNYRFGEGGLLQGGVSLGRTVTNNCFVVDSPQDLYQCEVVSPAWARNGQFKLAGSYPLPGGIEFSAVFQNMPGQEILATVTFFNAAVAPSLGRNLSNCPAATGACNATVNLQVMDRFSEFEDRINQLDFRVAKVFRGDFGNLRASLDLYNALNAAPVLGRNNNFGTTGVGWGRPTAIMAGRLVKVSATFDWN